MAATLSSLSISMSMRGRGAGCVMAAVRAGGVKEVAPRIESALALSKSRGVLVKSVICERIS